MREVVICSACRTPVGKFQGSLASLKAVELGAIVIKDALKRASAPKELVSEVIMGMVLQAGQGQNPARQAAIRAEIPDAVSSLTINKVCGSGLKAVMLAAQAIKAGDADLIVAGGMESMSSAPYLLPSVRDGIKMGHGSVVDHMIHDGLWDAYNDYHMGMTAELVSKEFNISRQDQDNYALGSQTKAANSQKNGLFKAEITPVTVTSRKESKIIQEDEGIRGDTTLESLSKLKPAFQKDGGTVTAGNASTINDGAAALVLAEEGFARKNGLNIIARIKGYQSGGMAPQWVMMAPVVALEKLFQQCAITKDQVDLFEINEAFASASVAIQRKLALDPEKINIRGGSIALGHPIGASGARILTTLVYTMADKKAKTGVAALCLGGGNAVSVMIEAI